MNKTYRIGICLLLNCKDSENKDNGKTKVLVMQEKADNREKAIFEAMKRLSNEHLWLVREYFENRNICSYEIITYDIYCVEEMK